MPSLTVKYYLSPLGTLDKLDNRHENFQVGSLSSCEKILIHAFPELKIYILFRERIKQMKAFEVVQ